MFLSPDSFLHIEIHKTEELTEKELFLNPNNWIPFLYRKQKRRAYFYDFLKRLLRMVLISISYTTPK